MNIDKFLNVFGYKEFRGNQKKIITRIMHGGHCLVVMPTGQGKSLCFQLPALAHEGLTLVISPLIALMKDQVDKLKQQGIEATFVNSSLNRQEREERYEEIRKGRYTLLYVTPERFRKEDFRTLILTRKISLLAVDEAHCISQWGHDFRPDYTKISEIRDMLGGPTTVALTATATNEVQDDIIRQLGLTKVQIKIFHEGIERPNLKLAVKTVYDMYDKVEQIKAVLCRFQGSGIVYFSLINNLQKCSEKLTEIGIEHLCYFGTLPRSERERVQNNFMNGTRNLVLATNAFGMGIDKNNIRFVIHAEVPGSIESYYQEIGRAGRDGLPAYCLLLYDENDLLIQMEFIKWNNPEADFYRRVHSLIMDDRDFVNGYGLDGLNEMLLQRKKGDFRIETVLAILDRYHVTKGSLEKKDIMVIKSLPDCLSKQPELDKKLLRDHKNFYAMVSYVRTKGCRRDFLNGYFGVMERGGC